MNKQMRIDLAFSADTGKAKAQIQELQSLLNKIAYTGDTSKSTNKMQQNLIAASDAAKELQLHLNNAFNTSTGKFDLSSLHRSLQTSGSSIQNLSTQLLGAGKTGQQAFLKLAQSISLADQPMFKINNKLQEFATTMKNTVRWQLSSSMLHGFMGAIQGAYGYAKDLNKSLTDIRIVTGYSADEMAKFAEQANKAAKSLSTTTTDYTNASLIYFQQGLDNAQVEERTNVTIKMANATGTSAQVVSDQMTAIWNNFDDGSKSLEYYADVMTALGAATASSTDEISQGLQKFAAVSETVGLSYEYATAALTTIMSNTRESADVVGTALKTLFARIQGLQLGETLDDGTDLNKYSQALEKVDISIYQANGELKAMDDILDEMAAKWNTIDKAEQTALAQTVAGVRQYTQLVALMENWDKGDADSFQSNLKTIANADGALDEQADIYAQSWEAAEKRVRAAAEGIYQSLLDDDFFISLNNGFAGLLTGIDAFIDGAGGVKTILTGLASIVISNFAHKIPDALETFKHNLQLLTPNGTQSVYKDMQDQMQQATQTLFTETKKQNPNFDFENSSMGTAIKQANELTEARNRLALVSDKMSQAERQNADMTLGSIQMLQEEIRLLKEKRETRQRNIGADLADIRDNASENYRARQESSYEFLKYLQQSNDKGEGLFGAVKLYLEDGNKKYEDIQQLFNTNALSQKKIAEISTGLNAGQGTEAYANAMAILKKSLADNTLGTRKLIESLKQISPENTDLENLIKELRIADKETDEINGSTTILKGLLDNFKPTHVVRTSEALGSMAAMAGNAYSIFMGLNSLIQNLSNPDLSGWEKFGAILSSFSMTIPSILSLISNFATLSAYKTTLIEKENIALAKQAMLNQINAYTAVGAEKEVIAALSKETKEKMALVLANTTLAKSQNKLTKEEKDKLITQLASIIAGEAKVNATHKQIAANLLEADSNVMLEKTLWGVAKSRIAAMPLSAKIILAIVAAIAAAVAIISALSTSQKEANEAINEANEKYKEAKSELDELNTSLESTKKRIEELNEQDSLTIVEQAELDKLKEEQLLLEKQKVLKEQLANSAQKERIAEIEKNYKKSSKLTKEPATIMKGLHQTTKGSYKGQYGLTESIDTFKSRVGYSDNMSTNELDEWLKADEKNKDYYDKIINWENEIQEAHAKWLQDNAEQIEANETNYLNYIQDLRDQNIDREDKKDYISEQQGILKEQREKVYGDDYEEAILTPIVSQIEDLSKINFSSGEKLDWGNIIGIKNLDLAGVASEEFDNYMDAAIQKIHDRATKLDIPTNKINRQLQKLDSKELEILLKNLDQLEDWDGSIPLKNFISGIDDNGELLQRQINEIKTLKDDLNELIKVTSDLEIGSILSEEDYQLLIKYNEELAKYFMLTSDGYQYLGGADKDIFTASIDAQIEKIQKYNQFYDTFSAFGKKVDGIWTATDWEAYALGEQEVSAGTLQNIAKQDVDWSLVGDGSYTADKINDIANNLSSEEGQEAAQAFMEAFYDTFAIGSASGGVEEINELKYSTATSLYQLDEIDSSINDNEAYSKGLQHIAVQYDTCRNELEAYNEAIKDGNRNSKKAKKAQEELAKAIRKAEWDKFTDGALDAAKALKKATSQKDIEKNLATIQKSFKKAFGMDVPMKTLEKFKDNFIKWGQATEEESDDIATQLYSLLQLEENVAEGFADFIDKEITLEVGADTYAAESKFSNLQDFYSSVKSIVEANPPVVDAYGNADFSNMIAAMLEAGYTAADVAAALQSIGQTEVDFSAWGSALPNVNFGDIDSIINFINALNSWKGDIAGNTNAPITAEAIKNTFGGSLPAATGSGGGRHSGGSSSGGGGGGSAPKHAEKKSDSDKERYHTLLNQLEDLNSEYDEISDAADRAFGQDKLDAIDDQIDKTDELIDKQEEYLDAIKDYYEIDKATMLEAWDGSTGEDDKSYFEKHFGILPEIVFDEKGNIANFDELQDKMFEIYNQATQKWTEDSEEWEIFEKKYEQFEGYIEQYEETYDLLRDEEAAYQELLNQRLDLQLEKVEYGVELNLNIDEDDLAVLEFQLDLLEDKAFESANRIALSTKQASNLYDQILINQKGLEDALGLSLSPAEIAEMMQGDMSALEGKTFTESQIDAIKEYRDNLLDLNSELIDIQQQVEDEVLAAFDEWHEELDRGMERFDHYENVLENYKNIVDIVGKDVLGLDNENIAKLSEAQVNNSINRLKASRDAYESYQKSAEEAENKMKKAQEDAAAARQAGNEDLAKSYDEDAEFWKETAREMNDSAQDAQEELMDNWGNTLDVIVSQFEEAVERAVESFNDAIYELGGLEGLSEDFNRAKEDDDTYLDDYQKIYELSKLTRDINNKIDDTDIIAGKQKLKALLEDINELQEDGVEMSQYDLEYLQATYDLRLAELELEEARNAKNTVRLQKDNEGNWSYIYTQNTDAVDSAQQKYEDALYAMQDLSTNYIDEMSEKLISTSQEMQEALAAVRVEDYASLEEYYAELDRIERMYGERMAKQQEELQKGLDNNKTLYNTDWLNYSEATGYKISKAEEFAQAFNTTMLGQLTNTDTVDAFGQLITSATTTLVSGLTTAATTYYENIGLATEAAGTSISDFADLLEEDIEAIKSKSDDAATSVEDMASRMDTAITDIIDKVAGWQEEYGREIDKIINKNLRVIETYNNMIKALSGASGKITISYDVDSETSAPVESGATVPEGTAQAATGGYTGNWGSNEGKLAILHQRELILNELDTSNFLQALEVTRQIMSVIDLQAKQASLGLGALTASTLKDEKPNEILEQEVHITAEFPNVNNHYEIEEAFNTLINTASQYANRK